MVESGIRTFEVYNKETQEWLVANGVDELSKCIGVPVKDISPIRLFRVTFGHYTVVEKLKDLHESVHQR